jgi:hypothetical protein
VKEYQPIHFIGETIEAVFNSQPYLEKKPGCPAGFVWRGQTYQVVELLSEWHDYGRRGRMARNMQPQHAARAATRGSWGVGQDYYRVLTDSSRIFDIYFDRAPKSVRKRKGEWVLYQELSFRPT